MERLKPLATLTTPDSRQSASSVLDPLTGCFRQVEIGDVYNFANAITLHEGVPEDVRTHFATALNLIAYSWFYYPFNVTAQFIAYVSVESALKLRFAVTGKSSFSDLVKRAVREGLVKDSGFAHAALFQHHQLPPELEFFEMAPAEVSPYVDTLVQIMPY